MRAREKAAGGGSGRVGTDEIVFRLAVRARGRVRPHEVALFLATVRLRAGG